VEKIEGSVEKNKTVKNYRKNKKMVLTKGKRCSILIFASGKRGKDNGKRIERDE